MCAHLCSSCWLGVVGNAVFRRNYARDCWICDFCSLWHRSSSAGCCAFAVQSQFPSVAKLALTLCVGYQWLVEGSFETDCSSECLCPLLLHLLRWVASDQPEPRLQRAGAASNPILCSKVKQTSHRPLLWCALRHQSHISATAHLLADDKSQPSLPILKKKKKKRKKNLICKSQCISTDMVHIQLQACFLSLLVLFTRSAQQRQHKVEN